MNTLLCLGGLTLLWAGLLGAYCALGYQAALRAARRAAERDR